MKRYLYSVATLLMLGIMACTPLRPEEAEPSARTQPVGERSESGDIQQRLAQLPGAQLLSEGELVGAVYPQGALFARRAVLPLPGGIAMLEPLATLLKEEKQRHWRVVLSAQTGQGGDYDQRLAQQRQVLMRRYLQRRGVTLEQIEFTVAPGEGSSLQLLLVAEPQESSSEVLNE
ncbi:MAG: hypothetical protein C0624_01930 [Desulfuromonas sp.]|nr:MAG: hypothetical protein C0624_01930 [Desulfuromonas sp.]